VPVNTGSTSASAGKLFKPSGYLLSLAPVYYSTRNQLVKEYIEAGRQASIIAVNLSVSDAEEADKLAFNLTTAGITLISAGASRSLVDGIANRVQREQKA